jgi:hypothetical protein
VSIQRVCDVDNTPINPETDIFYTVIDGRSGKEKDVCRLCARSIQAVVPWAASTGYNVGDRVHPTSGLAGHAYDCITAGTSGTTQPTWPTTVGATFTDGTVEWKTDLKPKDYVDVQLPIVGSPDISTSLYGWMTGTLEPS